MCYIIWITEMLPQGWLHNSFQFFKKRKKGNSFLNLAAAYIDISVLFFLLFRVYVRSIVTWFLTVFKMARSLAKYFRVELYSSVQGSRSCFPAATQNISHFFKPHYKRKSILQCNPIGKQSRFVL